MASPPALPHLGGVIPSHIVYGPGQSPFTSAGHMLPPAQPQTGPWAQRPTGSAAPGNSVPQQMPLMPPQVMLQYHRQQATLHSSPPLPYGQMPYGNSPPPGPDHFMQQKMNEAGMPREFWDQREQRFDPQFRPRPPHHRFHQQNLSSDGGHGGTHDTLKTSLAVCLVLRNCLQQSLVFLTNKRTKRSRSLFLHNRFLKSVNLVFPECFFGV